MKRTPMKRSAPLRAKASPSTSVKPVKPKVCDQRKGGCGFKFTPARPMQLMCGPQCAQGHAEWLSAKKRTAAEKQDRKETKAKLEQLKTKPQLEKEVEKSMNHFVRLRDWEKGCVSCDKHFNPDQIGGSCDAGHYRSKGSAIHLRFDQRNVHGQCKHCNDYLGGNPTGYRVGLIARIGLEEVEALEADQEPRKYLRDELRTLRDIYRAAVRQMLKGQKPVSLALLQRNGGQ